jgi:predicted DNA-binding transcriptional regulator YafY
MKNLVIPNPTKYEITYTDSKGEQTERKIVVIGQEKDSITAYCYHSHGVRTFKKDNISKITSVS